MVCKGYENAIKYFTIALSYTKLFYYTNTRTDFVNIITKLTTYYANPNHVLPPPPFLSYPASALSQWTILPHRYLYLHIVSIHISTHPSYDNSPYHSSYSRKASIQHNSCTNPKIWKNLQQRLCKPWSAAELKPTQHTSGRHTLSPSPQGNLLTLIF